MRIQFFVDEINSVFPDLNQIVAKYSKIQKKFGLADAISYKKRNLLLITNNQEVDNIIDGIIYNTNLPSIGIGRVNFYLEKVETLKGVYEFANYNDFFTLCYDISGKIILSDPDRESFTLSESTEAFLNFLLVYDKYYKGFIFDMTHDITEHRKNIDNLVKNGVSKKWILELMPEVK